MEKLIANLSSKVQKKTLQGREYLVAPVAMLVEGVLAGSQGPILYEQADIVRSVAAWNHKPITVGHPELPNGEKVSGCTPESLETMGCGMILNTRYNKKTKKLVAEAWFDVARLPVVYQGTVIANALSNETKLEVSTGLFVEAVQTKGTFGDKEYIAKATNFQPDHLAIILNGVGACSLADGAGLLVNKADKKLADCRTPIVNAAMATEDEGEAPDADEKMSLQAIVEGVRRAVYAKYQRNGTQTTPEIYPYIEDIYEDYVVFCLGDKVYRQNYAVENDSVKLLAELIPVTRKVTYEPIVANRNEKVDMDRTALATALGEAHKDFVANMTDEQVAAIAAVKAPKAEPTPVANSLDEVVAAAPSHLQPQLQDALVANKRLRDSYVTVIVANKANAFSDAELGAMSTASLEKLATLATAPVVVANANPAPVAPQTKPLFAGSPVTNAAPADEKPFTAPSTL